MTINSSIRTRHDQRERKRAIMRYWIEEEYRIESSRKHVEQLFHAFPTWAGTNPIAEYVDDFDMSIGTNLHDSNGLHRVGFSCSVEALTGIDHRDLPLVKWAKGVGEATVEAHRVVQAFFSLHDTGAWRVDSGLTRVHSSGQDEDVENPHLSMTLHHTEQDLSMLYQMPDPESWLSHHRQ